MKSAGANATQGASQQTIDEAAEDAQAEQEMVNDAEQSAGDSRFPAAAGGGASKAKLLERLLEHRLIKADNLGGCSDKEKDELAARVAQLEARLKDRDAEAAAKPAPSPKVMHTFCFSKFNLQKKL